MGSGAEVAELCLLACPVLSPAEGLGSAPSSLTRAPATFQSWGPTDDMGRGLVLNTKAEPLAMRLPAASPAPGMKGRRAGLV